MILLTYSRILSVLPRWPQKSPTMETACTTTYFESCFRRQTTTRESTFTTCVPSSGIVGNPRRPFRRLEAEFVSVVRQLAMAKPEILVSHDGPDAEGTNLHGWPSIRHALETAPATLMVRGHAFWSSALSLLANGSAPRTLPAARTMPHKTPAISRRREHSRPR